jgi:Arc/MetJ family transcription regulator
MTRTSVDIDDALVGRVMRRYGVPTKRAGTTIRRRPACLIAAVAIRADVELLHQDADFDAIALHCPVRTAQRV